MTVSEPQSIQTACTDWCYEMFTSYSVGTGSSAQGKQHCPTTALILGYETKTRTGNPTATSMQCIYECKGGVMSASVRCVYGCGGSVW